jgi:hypothetical protein
MKFALPMAITLLSATVVPEVFAQTYSTAATRPAPRPSAAYCTSDRFQNYVLMASAMRDFVTPELYARLYIPLKVKAAKAQITLKNYGPLSATTHETVMEIVRFVDQNQNEFDALWEVEAFFYIARDLMDMTQALARDLQ